MEGSWNFHIIGEERAMYYATVGFNATDILTSSKQSADGLGAQWESGQSYVGAGGEVSCRLVGTSFFNGERLEVITLQGRMDLTKNYITFAAEDAASRRFIFVMVKTATAGNNYGTGDLNGNWDVFMAPRLYGSITIKDQVISGRGNFRWGDVVFGGALGIDDQGFVNGTIQWTGSGFTVSLGRMNKQRNMIVCSGKDAEWWRTTFFMVKTN
jgi:hypothetical protein